MIQCEHFYFGLFNGIGIKLVKTSNVDKLLTQARLNELCHIGDKLRKNADLQNWLQPEGILALSHIEITFDEYNRKGVKNHTVLLDAKDWFDYTQPISIIKTYFLRELNKPPEKLEPIKIESEQT